MGIEQFLGASLKHTEGLQFLVLFFGFRFQGCRLVVTYW